MLVYSPNGSGSKSKPCCPFKTRIASKCHHKMAVRRNETENGTDCPCTTLTSSSMEAPRETAENCWQKLPHSFECAVAKEGLRVSISCLHTPPSPCRTQKFQWKHWGNWPGPIPKLRIRVKMQATLTLRHPPNLNLQPQRPTEKQWGHLHLFPTTKHPSHTKGKAQLHFT